MNKMTIGILSLIAGLNVTCGNVGNQTTDQPATPVSQEITISAESEDTITEITPLAEERHISPQEPIKKTHAPIVRVNKKEDTRLQEVNQSEENDSQFSGQKLSAESPKEISLLLENDIEVRDEEDEETIKNEEEVIEANDGQKELNPVQLETAGKPSHAKFDALLSSFVSSKGVVNYKGLLGKKADLEAYLSDLSNNPVEGSWSRNEKLAYWINAYNAFTIKLILDHFPVNSIQDIDNGKPWDNKWIKLGDKTYSLNQIENEIIRPQFNEPRIHFAVNCAAQSCPPLANKAFTADNLNGLLEKQTRNFINNSRYNTIGASKVEISKIFDWYGVDFDNLISFLNSFADTEIKANAKVEFKDYDWALNNK